MAEHETSKAYAVAILQEVEVGPEIVTYLERIDATLAPFGGRFIIHGGEVTELEGAWQGHPALSVVGYRLQQPLSGACLLQLPHTQRDNTLAAITVSGQML